MYYNVVLEVWFGGFVWLVGFVWVFLRKKTYKSGILKLSIRLHEMTCEYENKVEN